MPCQPCRVLTTCVLSSIHNLSRGAHCKHTTSSSSVGFTHRRPWGQSLLFRYHGAWHPTHTHPMLSSAFISNPCEDPPFSVAHHWELPHHHMCTVSSTQVYGIHLPQYIMGGTQVRQLSSGGGSHRASNYAGTLTAICWLIGPGRGRAIWASIAARVCHHLASPSITVGRTLLTISSIPPEAARALCKHKYHSPAGFLCLSTAPVKNWSTTLCKAHVSHTWACRVNNLYMGAC